MDEKQLIDLAMNTHVLNFEGPRKLCEGIQDLVSDDLSIPCVVEFNSRVGGRVEQIGPLNDVVRSRMDAYLCFLKELSDQEIGGPGDSFKGGISIYALESLHYAQNGKYLYFFNMGSSGYERIVNLSFGTKSLGAGEKRGYVFEVEKKPSKLRDLMQKFGLDLN